MKKPVTVTTERVDDIPLLLAQLKRMGVQELFDQHFPTHGNWQGLSLGYVAVVWLTHILSQADHRLNPVQEWLEHHLETVGVSLDQDLRGLDLSDDRLEGLLRYLSKDDAWESFEQALSQRQLQVYDISPSEFVSIALQSAGFGLPRKKDYSNEGIAKIIDLTWRNSS
jgi:transposase